MIASTSVSELQDAVRQQLQVILTRAGILKYIANDASRAAVAETAESYDAIERAVRRIDVMLSPQATPKGS
jgi:hypothetical protein